MRLLLCVNIDSLSRVTACLLLIKLILLHNRVNCETDMCKQTVSLTSVCVSANKTNVALHCEMPETGLASSLRQQSSCVHPDPSSLPVEQNSFNFAYAAQAQIII